jgi:predicted  nucleic acid-binding Zn-ribbon protein
MRLSKGDKREKFTKGISAHKSPANEGISEFLVYPIVEDKSLPSKINPMSKAAFQNLIEAQSHLKQIGQLKALIESELARVRQLEHLKLQKLDLLAQTQARMDEYKSRLLSGEKKLSDIDRQLKQSQGALAQSTTQQSSESAQRQIDLCEKELEIVQDELFVIMEQESTDQDRLDEIQGFLDGFQTTYDEISNEANSVASNLGKEIEGYEERVNNLLSLCPQELIDIFNHSRKNIALILLPTYKAITLARVATAKWREI